MAVYSINFNVAGEPDLYAADWNWLKHNRWAYSVRQAGLGNARVNQGNLNEAAYRALLQHFGLQAWRQEFTLLRVMGMSPAKLAEARRRKERLYGLKPLNMVSQTMGDRRPAELFA